jgi:uncharacterized LabA/DUF88 family protein
MMTFVDGSNLLIELGKLGVGEILAEKPSIECLDLALRSTTIMTAKSVGWDHHLIRRHWFGSFVGDEPYKDQLLDKLRKYRFDGHLFRRRGNREKGVDIALTKEMLINAFADNYDEALLIAGDEDYVGLVEDLKRYGVIIHGAFLESGVAPALRRACDDFLDPSRLSGREWGTYIEELKKQVSPRRGSAKQADPV